MKGQCVSVGVSSSLRRTQQGRERIKAGCEGRFLVGKDDRSLERGRAANKGPQLVSNFVHKDGNEQCVYGGLPMAQPTIAAGWSGHRFAYDASRW